jgi:5-deoxy-glucuronate isomerase
VLLTPETAGWTYCGLQVVALEAGESRVVDTADREYFVLPLSATAVTVAVEAGDHGPAETFSLNGRRSVFDRVSDFVYVGRGQRLTLSSESGGEVALPSARCDQTLPPRLGSARDVAVEVRGAGQATRQITNFASPEAWPHADKLMCVEVYTPDGNWSSYPPHKHDDSPECPVNIEEAYYFRIGKLDQEAKTIAYAPEGIGVHRTYRGERPDLGPDSDFDDNMTVGDGDIYVIPRGYHGPCISAPGYPMYYLNVLAGPSAERSMAFCDDPSHHWIRSEWEDMPLDPRCPMVTADGLVFP